MDADSLTRLALTCRPLQCAVMRFLLHGPLDVTGAPFAQLWRLESTTVGKNGVHSVAAAVRASVCIAGGSVRNVTIAHIVAAVNIVDQDRGMEWSNAFAYFAMRSGEFDNAVTMMKDAMKGRPTSMEHARLARFARIHVTSLMKISDAPKFLASLVSDWADIEIGVFLYAAFGPMGEDEEFDHPDPKNTTIDFDRYMRAWEEMNDWEIAALKRIAQPFHLLRVGDRARFTTDAIVSLIWEAYVGGLNFNMSNVCVLVRAISGATGLAIAPEFFKSCCRRYKDNAGVMSSIVRDFFLEYWGTDSGHVFAALFKEATMAWSLAEISVIVTDAFRLVFDVQFAADVRALMQFCSVVFARDDCGGTASNSHHWTPSVPRVELRPQSLITHYLTPTRIAGRVGSG
eukprot:Opistho-2@38758